MSIFEDVVAAVSKDGGVPAPQAMPTLLLARERMEQVGRTDEARAVDRVAEYRGEPLHELPLDAAWFEREFPPVRSSAHVPGQERSFWRTRSAYMRWRRKVRNAIRHATGDVAEVEGLRARDDGWRDLLALLDALSRDGGPVHPGEAGAVRSFADYARRAEIEPHALDAQAIDLLLEAAPSTPIRRKITRALTVLQRYTVIGSVAEHLPPRIEIDRAKRRLENALPEEIERGIESLVQIAGRDAASWDETTQSYSKRRRENTLAAYRSALNSYAWSAERCGAVALDTLNDLEHLFAPGVFYSVIQFWTNRSDEKDGIAARSAWTYTGWLLTVLNRNGIEADHIARTRANNPFLLEGKEATRNMSPKVERFCQPLVRHKPTRRTFLTQHFEYRARAEDLLATDKAISGKRLMQARMFGTCAAAAAIEIAGAPLRVKNLLQRRHRGPNPNVLRPAKGENFYQILVDPVEMKVRKKMPIFKLRANALRGRQTLDWYLKEIRPLFPFGNSEWCESTENEIGERIRFGIDKRHTAQTESLYLFVAPTSAAHLSKSVYYEWLVSASEAIGLPMTPHLYRHGLATIMLKRTWSNVNRVAVLLNITPGIVLRNYGWIDRESEFESAQDEILQEVA